GALAGSAAAADHLAGELLVDRDVVERAGAILQGSRVPLGLAQPLARLAADEQAGEEFRRIAQLLDGDAQLVAPAGVELGELFRLPGDLPDPPRQLVAG